MSTWDSSLAKNGVLEVKVILLLLNANSNLFRTLTRSLALALMRLSFRPVFNFLTARCGPILKCFLMPSVRRSMNFLSMPWKGTPQNTGTSLRLYLRKRRF